MSISCPKQSQHVYRPRRPEKTVLFEVVKKHYKTWLQNTEKTVPQHVDKTFKKYLECGIVAKGFAVAHCDSCHKDFCIAFSCKRRGLCPSCNTRAMVETAAHLVENVIPQVPVRQFVISFPMRIRHYLKTQAILQDVLHLVVDEIRQRLVVCNPDIPNPQIGAISFIQYFGTALNLHPHFHFVVADGVFNAEGEELQFHETFLTPDDILDMEESIRKRVLKYFCRRGWFEKAEVKKMLTHDNSGFSLDASVQIPAWDREGLERLIRYCSRPPFKSENLRWNGPWLIYRLPKATHTGKTFVQCEPLEFLEKIAAFIPYPRSHRRHYHGVFAPHSPLRAKVAANAQRRLSQSVPTLVKEVAEKTGKVSLNWSKLIARIYEDNPLLCVCGKEMKIVAFVTHSAEIKRILAGIGWPTEAPEFDEPYALIQWDICQLDSRTKDGFSEIEEQMHVENGPDPPLWEETVDPPHEETYIDPPHWED